MLMILSTLPLEMSPPVFVSQECWQTSPAHLASLPRDCISSPQVTCLVQTPRQALGKPSNELYIIWSPHLHSKPIWSRNIRSYLINCNGLKKTIFLRNLLRCFLAKSITASFIQMGICFQWRWISTLMIYLPQLLSGVTHWNYLQQLLKLSSWFADFLIYQYINAHCH